MPIAGASGTSGAEPARGADPTPRGRIVSVDALRGFDMIWIVGAASLVQALAKLGDSPILKTVHDQLDHKEWEGFAFLDLIFPLFIFLAGMSVVFSLTRILERSGRWAAYGRILRRALLIYALGFIYYGGFSKAWPDIRLLGVLQRIAICYLAAGILFCHLRARGLAIACAAILIAYWLLMTFVPVPGIGAGSFAPERNLANYLDAKYLPGFKWDGTWDPEGLLSTIPAVGTCLLGVLAGMLVRAASVSNARKVLILIAGGGAAVGLGFLWGLQFPVVKKIWTSSYVLVAGGYSAIALGIFYLVIDVWRIRAWARPFIWVGANPITIYMLDGILDYERFARLFAGGDIHRLCGRYGDVVLWSVALGSAIAIAAFLHRRKIFLRA
ncbi:MAG: DUF1624 domain-containing protein [Planctomycetes bacterium]|nr:DUF1624 domain-containing protein [Planctomycetota bacterium]